MYFFILTSLLRIIVTSDIYFGQSAVLTAAPFRRRGISKHKPITAEIK
jgi:hypothetical protein